MSALCPGVCAENDAKRAHRSAATRVAVVPNVDVEPLTTSIGAVVSGVDLRSALSSSTAAALRDALLRWRVIFLRDQHITPTQQVAFGRLFGELTPAHPLQGGLDEEHPEVLVLDSRDYSLGIGDRGDGTSYNNRWHTDVTFSSTPPMASILSAKEIPAQGGDTLWADLVGAYQSLSAPVQALADELVAVHHAAQTFDRFQDGDANRSRLAALDPTRHPVVRVHPETGERGLFVNPTFTSHIEGLTQDRERTPAPPVVRAHRHAGTRRALAVAHRRRRDVGQPGDGALRRGRLRRAATDAPDHGGRRPTGRRERPARLSRLVTPHH